VFAKEASVYRDIASIPEHEIKRSLLNNDDAGDAGDEKLEA
jgi:hypothetical protein